MTVPRPAPAARGTWWCALALAVSALAVPSCGGGTAWIGSNACGPTDTDPANCGACGHDCLGAACSGGVCAPETIAAGTGRFFALGTDGSNVYWSNFDADGGSLWKVTPGGGAATELTTGITEVFGLAAAGGHVLFSTFTKRIVGDVGAGGGAPTTLAPESGPAQCTAFDGTYFYWGLDGRAGGPVVERVPVAGGAVSTVATGGQANVLAVDGADLFYTDYPDGLIVHVPAAGGAPRVLAQGQALPWGIAVDATYVYWANYGDGNVMRVLRAGGAAEVLAGGQTKVNSLAKDGASLYFTLESGDVMKLPLGHAPYPVALAQTGRNVLILGPYLYWTNATGSLIRVAK